MVPSAYNFIILDLRKHWKQWKEQVWFAVVYSSYFLFPCVNTYIMAHLRYYV